MGPACMQGLPKLPHSISDDHYIKMLKDKEDKKKKEEEEKEKRNKEHEEKVDRERTEGSIERGKEVHTKGVKSKETSQEG